MLKGKENQSLQRKKETLETDSASTQTLNWLDRELKITMINMLPAVMEKLDNMQEQMDNVSREMESLRQNQKEMLEIKKNTVTEIKNAFDTFITRLDMAEERIQ